LSDIPLPSPTGLVVFEKPIIGTDSNSDQEVQVDAINWGVGTMAPTPSRPNSEECLGISSYRCLNVTAWDKTVTDTLKNNVITSAQAKVLYANKPVEPRWSYLGRSDWPLVDSLNQAPFGECTEQQALSFIEDRRIMAALFTLLAQEAISETEYISIPRQTRRRAERVGVAPEANNLRVINLRKRLRNVPAEDGEPIESAGRYSHRWVVNPFYRWQRVGPGRQERRLTLVSGHVRGPEDRPLKLKQEVRAWVR
jgi:hypothetical protein